MKKLFLAIAAVAMVFATSCKKENINGAEEPVVAADNEFVCVIDQNASQQNAPAVSDDMGTLAHIDNSNNVWWQEGDQIAYYGTENTDGVGRYELTCSKLSDNSAYFSAEGKHFGQGAHEAYYPASIMTLNGTQKVLTLPSTINLEAGKNAGQLPMIGTGTGQHYLTFSNICAVLKIAVPTTITHCNKIVLSASQPITGPFTMNGTKAVLASTGTSTTITVNAPSGENFSGIVYVAIPENKTNGYTNFTVQYMNGTASLCSRTNPSAMKVEAGKIYPVTVTPVPQDCFCFTALDNDGVTIYMKTTNWNNPFPGYTPPTLNLQYCKYDAATGSYTSWNTFTPGYYWQTAYDGQGWDYSKTAVPLSHTGDKLYIRANGTSPNTSRYYDIASDIFNATGTGKVEVSGNIMYLRNGTNPSSDIPNENWVFAGLFSGMTNLKSASDLVLPGGTAQYGAFARMFRNCENLFSGPKIRTAGFTDCFQHEMYVGCKHLSYAYCNAGLWNHGPYNAANHIFDGTTSSEAYPRVIWVYNPNGTIISGSVTFGNYTWSYYSFSSL